MPGGPCRQRRGDRLRGEAEFARMFRTGKRLGARHIQLLYAHAAEGRGRVGYVIGRKELPRAVDRNRLRRILREALRARRNLVGKFDIVLRLVAACVPAELPEVGAEAAVLLDALGTGMQR